MTKAGSTPATLARCTAQLLHPLCCWGEGGKAAVHATDESLASQFLPDGALQIIDRKKNIFKWVA
jgi:hypothetical protein